MRLCLALSNQQSAFSLGVTKLIADSHQNPVSKNNK